MNFTALHSIRKDRKRRTLIFFSYVIDRNTLIFPRFGFNFSFSG